MKSAHDSIAPRIGHREGGSGDWILRAAWGSTILFAVTQIAADVRPTGLPLAAATFVSSGLFLVGSVVFLVGFVIAVGRSRDEQITLAGLVWLIGVAPARTARIFRIVIVAQVVIAVVTATVRPFTALAFGILAPMSALGFTVWWSARYGSFDPIKVSLDDRRHPDDRAFASAGSSGTKAVPVDGVPDTWAETTEMPAEHGRVDPGIDDDSDDFDQLFRRRRKPKQ